MLLINRAVMLIDAGNSLEFLTGFGKVIPFSINLSNFCRSLRVESNTTIKIYISYDVLLVNEVHKRTVFLHSGPNFMKDHLPDAN